MDISDSERSIPVPRIITKDFAQLCFAEGVPFQAGFIVCVCEDGIIGKVINSEAKAEKSIITSELGSRVLGLARRPKRLLLKYRKRIYYM